MPLIAFMKHPRPIILPFKIRKKGRSRGALHKFILNLRPWQRSEVITSQHNPFEAFVPVCTKILEISVSDKFLCWFAITAILHMARHTTAVAILTEIAPLQVQDRLFQMMLNSSSSRFGTLFPKYPIEDDINL